jgi:hypothetical protein
MNTEFQNVSYDLHKEHFKSSDAERLKFEESWFDETTVDYWRHHRMYAPLTPLIKAYPNSKWLTVGDGRFGLDSVKLKKIEPTLDVLPTDISPYLLQ